MKCVKNKKKQKNCCVGFMKFSQKKNKMSSSDIQFTMTTYKSLGGFESGLVKFIKSNVIIESNTLEHARHGIMTIAIHHFLYSSPADFDQSNWLGNPSSFYAAALGGRHRTCVDQNGEFGMCYFADGSAIEEWSPFRGASSDVELANKLCNWLGIPVRLSRQ